MRDYICIKQYLDKHNIKTMKAFFSVKFRTWKDVPSTFGVLGKKAL